MTSSAALERLLQSPLSSVFSESDLSQHEQLTNSHKIHILDTPTTFYNKIIELIQTSQEEVILSALYLGNGKLEQGIVDEIDRALNDPTRPNLKFRLIFDHSRAQRGPNSSLDMLQFLLKRYNTAPKERIGVYLYQMPQLRNSFLLRSLPSQLREVLAVYHIKFIIADQHIILTGANLGTDYFTSRQDRYWFIEDLYPILHPRGTPDKPDLSLLGYIQLFADIVCDDSFTLQVDGPSPISPKIYRELDRPSHIARNNDRSSLRQSIIEKESLVDRLTALDSSATKDVDTFAGTLSLCEMRVLPLIQLAAVGYREEERSLVKLMQLLSSHSHKDSSIDMAEGLKLVFSTPYTNFSSSLISSMLNLIYASVSSVFNANNTAKKNLPDENIDKRGVALEVIGPDEDSHGFAGASGFKGLIPKLHRAAFRNAYVEAVEKLPSFPSHISREGSSNKGTSDVFDVYSQYMKQRRFARNGWTFHAKGLWWDYTSPPSGSDERYIGTYIGSSNFGERSWCRDFELGFLFLSPVNHARNRQMLQSDCAQLKKHAPLVPVKTSRLTGAAGEGSTKTRAATGWTRYCYKEYLEKLVVRNIAWLIKRFL